MTFRSLAPFIRVFIQLVICLWCSLLSAAEPVNMSITGEAVPTIVEAFNRSQDNWKLVIKSYDYINWRHAENQFRFKQKLTSSEKDNEIIDVAFVDNNWLPELIENRWIVPVTGSVEKRSGFVRGLLDAAEAGGEIYAVPFSNKGLVLFYRKDLHAKMKLRVPESLPELAANANVLMEQDKGLTHGLTVHYSAIHLDVLPFIWSNGGDILQDGKPVLQSDVIVQVFEYLKMLCNDRVLPDRKTFRYLGESYRNALKLFIEGKSPYLITWNNRISDLVKSPLKESFGIAPVPSFKKDLKQYTVNGSWYLAINNLSDRKKGAAEVLSFFCSDSAQKMMSLDYPGFLPVVNHVYNDPELVQKNPHLPELQKALKQMRHRLKHPKETEIGFIFENAVKQILVEGKPVKTVLAIADDRIGMVLEKSTKSD